LNGITFDELTRPTLFITDAYNILNTNPMGRRNRDSELFGECRENFNFSSPLPPPLLTLANNRLNHENTERKRKRVDCCGQCRTRFGIVVDIGTVLGSEQNHIEQCRFFEQREL
jgi:hypothetical protein